MLEAYGDGVSEQLLDDLFWMRRFHPLLSIFTRLKVVSSEVDKERHTTEAFLLLVSSAHKSLKDRTLSDVIWPTESNVA